MTTTKTSFYQRHRVLVWAAGIVAAVVLLASFMSRGEVVPIRVAAIERATIRSGISTNGKVEPLQNFESHAPAGTTVEKVFVKEGDHVKAGQLLVKLNDASARSDAAHAQAQVRAAQAAASAIENGGNREEVLTLESNVITARAERDAAQRRLEALKRLLQQGAASPGEVKDAENQLAKAQADLQLLQQKQKDRYSKPEIAQVEGQLQSAQAAYGAALDILKKLNVRAPFDGIVYSVPVRQGDYIQPGDLVLQEADLSQVLARAFVDEPDVGRLQAGQGAELTWDAMPGRIWIGAVSTVPASLKLRGTRNVGEVTFVVDNKDLSLLPNVNVGVTIITAEHKDALTIPREALRSDEKGQFVYVVANEELERHDVQALITNLTQAEITGLPEKTKVALASTNSKPLQNHLQVRAQQ